MTSIDKGMLAMRVHVIKGYAAIDMFAGRSQSASVEASGPCSVVRLQQEVSVVGLARGRQ